jgi:hypothetical protein
MSDAISSIKPKPQYFSSVDDPPTPLLPKKKPAVDLEHPAPAPAGTVTLAPTPTPTLANVDYSQWPTPLLERNVEALTKRLAQDPKSVTDADRTRLATMENVLSGRYGKEKVPALGDVSGKAPGVELCKRRTEIPIVEHTPLTHHWLKTSHKEAGMGAKGGGVPGHAGGNNGSLLGPTSINDHTGEADSAYASCEPLPNVDESCVDEKLQIGKETGRWFPVLNDCHGVVSKIIDDCTVKPKAANAGGADAGVP